MFCPSTQRRDELGLTLGRSTGAAPVGASRQDAEEDEPGCREADGIHLPRLEGELLRKRGGQQSF